MPFEPAWGELDYVEERKRQTEPYHFERDRQLFNKQPRFAQPNTSQPNQKISPQGWGMSNDDYWNGVYQSYLKRRKM